MRKTYTGKIGGLNDDLAITMQLAITGLRCFYQVRARIKRTPYTAHALTLCALFAVGQVHQLPTEHVLKVLVEDKDEGADILDDSRDLLRRSGLLHPCLFAVNQCVGRQLRDL